MKDMKDFMYDKMIEVFNKHMKSGFTKTHAMYKTSMELNISVPTIIRMMKRQDEKATESVEKQ
jgi:hypothetical protein